VNVLEPSQELVQKIPHVFYRQFLLRVDDPEKKSRWLEMSQVAMLLVKRIIKGGGGSGDGRGGR
jgi:hypothetical protein